jgi:hypothetical protein
MKPVTSEQLNSILNEDEKPTLDRHGRIKVAHWGSDDEEEAGTVKDQLRQMPPKNNPQKPKLKETIENILSEATALPWIFYILQSSPKKWVKIDATSTRDEIIQRIQLKLRVADVSLGVAKRTQRGNYEYPVLINGRKVSKYRVIGMGNIGGPYGS